jgi:hypothetical protein
VLLKEERMPDGTTKLILRHKQTGRVVHRLKKPDRYAVRSRRA